MKKIKTFLKLLIPPLLVIFVKRFLRTAIWKGNYKDWADAKRNSQGYDSSLILERVKFALNEVRTGNAVFERDSVLFYNPDEQHCLLSALLYCASKCGNRLNVVDFGGSLGSTYYQLKNILTSLPLSSFSWNVVEQPHFAEVGNQTFADKHLHFHTDLNTAVHKNLSFTNRILLMSASLQYLENPMEQLDKIINEDNFDFIVMARIPIHFAPGPRLTIQNVPESIYAASYPCWFFNEDEFLKPFSKKYKKVLTFSAPDICFDFPSTFKGYLFEREQSSKNA